jgi:K+-sensing histidine kinase KdpD
MSDKLSDKHEEALERQAELEAGEASERRGGYLAFVAHEVRNPLSTALWSAELLARMADADRGGPRGEKLTAMCLRSLARLRQLVEDHFLCERLDVGGLPVRREPVVVAEVLAEIASKRPPEAGPLELAIDPSLVVVADRNLIDQLLDALVAAAGRDGAAVRVASREGERLLLEFVGATPLPDGLEDPSKGSPSDPKGRALALPVARRVAVALGGGLAVEGSAYVLTLPQPAAYTPALDPAAHP